MENSNQNETKKKSGRGWKITITLLVILALLLTGGYIGAKYAYGKVQQLRTQASTLKSDIKKAGKRIAAKDLDGTETAVDQIEADAAQIRLTMADPFWEKLSRVKVVREELESVEKLLGVLDRGIAEIARPTISLLRTYPLKDIKTETGFNMVIINRYISFYGEIMPIVEEISAEMESVNLGIADSDGKIQSYLNQFTDMVNLLQVCTRELLVPVTIQLEAYPLSDLKVGDGFNVVLINNYLTFLEEIVPNVDRILEYMDSVEISDFDTDDKVATLEAQIREKLRLYREVEPYLPVMKAILGDGSDRYYLLAAQNTAEIRASGGFPGSMGTIEIKDGVLSVGDFKPVRQMLHIKTDGADITSDEMKYFSPLMDQAWDADFCPDFERVAYIWMVSHNRNNGVEADGVISLTPAVVQKLLGFLGEITLSDGTVIDGSNAMQVLEHDLYFKYLSAKNYSTTNTRYIDTLFAETAKEAMHRLVSVVTLDNITGFLGAFVEGTKDRTIMVWLKDEASQEVIRAAGCSGGLNSDPEKPAVGIYFSGTGAHKLGYFVNIEPTVSEPEENADGSKTYEVTVVFSNVITPEEVRTASHYITQGSSGIPCRMTFFAPAGGTIGDFQTSNGSKVGTGEYHGLQLGYLTGQRIYNGKPLTVTFRVTTAPNASEPLAISMTPTAQGYRAGEEPAA